MASTKPTIRNPAKEKLRVGQPIVGMSVFEALTPSIVKITAMLGFDLVQVDTEHSLHNNAALTSFLVSLWNNGMTPLVTVVSPERDLVSRMLDAGALGITLSHADTPEQMDDLVRWMKYPPDGERGLGMGASAGYDTSDVARYCQEANDAMLILPKIESALAVRNAKAIMSIEGVDGIVFGPGDLAIDMGFTGMWEHPEVLGALNGVVDTALQRGLAVEPASMPKDQASYRRELTRGVQIFGAMRRSEYDLLKEGAANAMAVSSPD